MRSLANKPNVVAPDADFPFGRIKDKVGSNPGTPVNEVVYGDIHQFFEKLMDEAGVTANGLPESEYSGFQLMTALVKIFGKLRRAVIEIGSWNMDADVSKIVNTTIPFDKVRGFTYSILNDSQGNLFTMGITQGGFNADIEAAAGGVDDSGNFQLLLSRTASGTFDSTNFDDTGVNRGYIIVEYEVDDY